MTQHLLLSFLIALGRFKRIPGSGKLEFSPCGMGDAAGAWVFLGMIQHLGRMWLLGGWKTCAAHVQL